MLASFPFKILGFHSDNGSEYINKRVAELLENSLLILPNHGRDIPTTMPWQKIKMFPLLGRYLAIPISLKMGFTDQPIQP